MPIKVTCSNCGGVLHAPDDAGGKRGRCPTCGNILPIPAPSANAGGGPELPDAPTATPGQRPPSFADFSPGAPIGPPPGASREPVAREVSPRPATPVAHPPAEAAPQRAARPPAPAEARRANDPFARKASFGSTAADAPPSEGLVKAWKRCRGGLWWVQAAMFFLLFPAVLVPGYYVADAVMKATSNAEVKPDLIPFKNPGYLGIQGLNSDVEVVVLAGAAPTALALLLILFGRLGFAGGPKRAAVGGPAMLSALGSLLALCCAIAVVFPNVFAAIQQIDPTFGGEMLIAADDEKYLGLIQRLGLFLGIGAVAVGEFWFASAVGRVGAALADKKTAARSTRFQMLLGAVAIGLVGTAAVQPAENFGLWSAQYKTGASDEPGSQFPTYNTREKTGRGQNPAFEVGKQTNDLVAGQWEQYVGPLFSKAGAFQPVVAPALFLLGGLIVWLMYVRMVGATRGAIRGWLDANAPA